MIEEAAGLLVKIGLGVAWNKEDPTASRDDIIAIARSLRARAGEARLIFERCWKPKHYHRAA
ncbi:hypothetical protein FQZ97_1041070 [compost metagenome]